MGRASQQQALLVFTASMVVGSLVLYARQASPANSVADRTGALYAPRGQAASQRGAAAAAAEPATLASRGWKRASFLDGVEPAMGVIDVYDTTTVATKATAAAAASTQATFGKDAELVEMTLTHGGKPVGRRGRVLIKLDRVVGPPASANCA